MLGPTLNAIYSWLSEPDGIDENSVFEEDNDIVQDYGVNHLAKIFGLGNWLGSSSQKQSEKLENENKTPINNCTGVALHLFLDSPQGLLS